MRAITIPIAFVCILASSSALAANHGRITRIFFAGAAFAPHPDVVQLEIEGGFSEGTCNAGLAAVRKSDNHLVSFLLTAYTTGAPINIVLNTNDRYNGDRCVISYAWSDPQS